MKIEKTFLEDHQVKLTLEVDPEPLAAAKLRGARKLAQNNRIPGFRPGKAPYAIIARTYGEAAILQEAVDLLLDELYPKMIEEAGIKPYAPGALNDISSMEPLTLEFTVPLEPEVTLSDYKAVRFDYEAPVIGEEDVDKLIKELQERYATIEPSEEPAADGSVVFLHLSAERKSPAEGQAPELIAERSTQLTVNPEGENSSTEWPFPGFSRFMLGLKPGEEKTFEYTYPEDSVLENLRGVEAVFHLQVDDVKLRKLPEVNDEFAHQLGDFETVEAMRQEVRNNLVEQRKNEYERDYHNKVVDSIIAASTIKYPSQMLERELEMFVHQLEHRIQDSGIDMPTYLKMRGLDDKGLREEMKEPAETRLRRSLVLLEIARVENIQVDENEVQNQAMGALNEIGQTYSPKEMRKMVNQEFIQNMISNITSDLLVRNTLNRLTYFASNGAVGDDPSAEAAAEETAQPEVELVEGEAESQIETGQAEDAAE